jgi:hypothetical protein
MTCGAGCDGRDRPLEIVLWGTRCRTAGRGQTNQTRSVEPNSDTLQVSRGRPWAWELPGGPGLQSQGGLHRVDVTVEPGFEQCATVLVAAKSARFLGGVVSGHSRETVSFSSADGGKDKMKDGSTALPGRESACSSNGG